jgi:hypothetical protein
MNNQAIAFLRAYLGPCAEALPSEAISAAIRLHLLTDDLANPLDAGAQSSPRNVPGKWPDAYAVHHKIVTPDEMRERWDKWIEMEVLRGLGGGTLQPKLTNVYKATHFTVTQHWLIGAMHPDPAQAKLSRKQALDLRGLILADKVMQPGDEWVGPSRGKGWSAQGLILDNLASQDTGALTGAFTLSASLHHGAVENDVPWIWKNPNAKKDPNHLYECSLWMDGTCLGADAALHAYAKTDGTRNALLHDLRIAAYCQREDGTFHDDFQPGQPDVFHEAPGESTETFIWPWLHDAHEALDDDWPSWAQLVVDRCQDRWKALNRFKPTDSGFRDMHNMAIAIGVAPLWGWRA